MNEINKYIKQNKTNLILKKKKKKINKTINKKRKEKFTFYKNIR